MDPEAALAAVIRFSAPQSNFHPAQRLRVRKAGTKPVLTLTFLPSAACKEFGPQTESWAQFLTPWGATKRGHKAALAPRCHIDAARRRFCPAAVPAVDEGAISFLDTFYSQGSCQAATSDDVGQRLALKVAKRRHRWRQMAGRRAADWCFPTPEQQRIEETARRIA